jgi:hypothetical protein
MSPRAVTRSLVRNALVLAVVVAPVTVLAFGVLQRLNGLDENASLLEFLGGAVVFYQMVVLLLIPGALPFTVALAIAARRAGRVGRWTAFFASPAALLPWLIIAPYSFPPLLSWGVAMTLGLAALAVFADLGPDQANQHAAPRHGNAA